MAVLEAVNPAVYGQLLATRPGILDDGVVADINYLFQNIEFAESVVTFFDRQAVYVGQMFVMHIVHMAQPQIDDADAGPVKCGQHAAAAVVADDHDVLDLEDIDGVLDHRQAVEVGMHHHVGDVAVDEELAGQQVHELIGRDAAVGAADPQVLRGLLFQQAREEARLAFLGAPGPGAVALEQLGQLGAHMVLRARRACARCCSATSQPRVYAAGPPRHPGVIPAGGGGHGPVKLTLT